MSIDGLGLKDIKVRFSAGEMFDVFAVQGDTLTRGFRATLIDPKTLKPLTPSESFTLQLIAERPENPDQYIVTDGVIEGDQYVVYLSTNMLISPGPLNLQLVLKSDEAVIRSAPWTINIPRALDMDGLRVQGKDILVDYTELRAQMTSFEERAAHITEETDIKLTAYQQAAANMSDMLGLMMGVYPSSEELEDGSKILYWHNKPTREESDLIWMFNGLVLSVSNDGGQTWTGQTSDGTVIARIVYTLQLFAQQIILTDGTTAQEAFDAAVTVFRDIPQPPYKQGDLWHMPELTVDYWLNCGLTVDQVMALGFTVEERMGGHSYVCVNSRTSGNFNRSDWKLTGTTDKTSAKLSERITTNTNTITEMGMQVTTNTNTITEMGMQVTAALSSGSWTLITGPVYSQSSPGRDVPFRKNLTTRSGYGILHMDFVAAKTSGVIATLPADAPRPEKTIEYQLFDAGSVWVDQGDNRVQAQGLTVGVRYLFNLLGFY